jgi:D-arabinose 1-dehydrogenase-like Zn-dependent alcohol dehydrogenase
MDIRRMMARALRRKRIYARPGAIPMKAVVFHGIGDIRLETVRDPKIKEPTDALIRITASAICGTDLHFVRGTLSGLEPGATLGTRRSA